jgi:hypothetical protein
MMLKAYAYRGEDGMRPPRTGHEAIGKRERQPVRGEQVSLRRFSQRAWRVLLEETINNDDANNCVFWSGRVTRIQGQGRLTAKGREDADDTCVTEESHGQ